MANSAQSNKNQGKKQMQNQQVKKKPADGVNALSGNANWYVIPAIIFFTCFLLYGNSIKHDYVLDDDIYTRGNAYVKKGFSEVKNVFGKGSLYGFNGSNESNYRPLVLLDFMAEVQWFGLNPHVNHFFNVLFFALCCVLLYYLMCKIFKAYNKLIPLAVTMLFVFHPIHTEVVASIKSRDEILGLLFGVVSFYFIFLYAEKNKLRDYTISVAAFFCSVLCKENSLTFIAIIPLLLYFFTSFDLKKIAITSLPYLGVVAICLWMRSNALSSVTFKDKMEVINNSLMAAKSGTDMLATEMVMMGKYVYMLFVPYPLSWDYSYNQIPNVSFANIKAIASVLVYMAMAVYVIRTIQQKSIHAFSILFYVITIFLSSNIIVKIGSSFAERLLFVPSLGLCMSLPLIFTSALKINPKNAVWQNKNLFYGLVGVVLVIYACILVPRNRDWADSLSLFKAGVIAAPNSARTHDALARELRSQAEQTQDPAQRSVLFAQSLNEFRKSVAIYNQSAEIYYNMGVTFYEAGMQDSAMNVYAKAIAIFPKYTMALNNMGVISFNAHKYDKAIPAFLGAYNADTSNMQALVNVGAAYQNSGDGPNAVKYYTMVLQKDPHNANAASNMSIMYVSSGMQYFDKKDFDNALQQFNLAVKYNPNNPNAYGNIGAVYQSKGDATDAIQYYQKALSIDPKNATFSQQLNALLQSKPR